MPPVLGFPLLLPELKLSFLSREFLFARERFLLLLVRLVLAFEGLLRLCPDSDLLHSPRGKALRPLGVMRACRARRFRAWFGKHKASVRGEQEREQFRFAWFRAERELCAGVGSFAFTLPNADPERIFKENRARYAVHAASSFCDPFFREGGQPGRAGY